MKQLYDQDFYEWTQQTAELLREGKLAELDLEHLAEEIGDMGNRDRRGVYNRLRVLLMHLIKWQIQPERRSRSWSATILEQRQRLNWILKNSPSLRRYAGEQLEEIYHLSALAALKATGLIITLPEQCPFTLDQILDDDFLPRSSG